MHNQSDDESAESLPEADVDPLIVKCPVKRCSADVGEPCVDATDEPVDRFHILREMAARSEAAKRSEVLDDTGISDGEKLPPIVELEDLAMEYEHVLCDSVLDDYQVLSSVNSNVPTIFVTLTNGEVQTLFNITDVDMGDNFVRFVQEPETGVLSTVYPLSSVRRIVSHVPRAVADKMKADHEAELQNPFRRSSHLRGRA